MGRAAQSFRGVSDAPLVRSGCDQADRAGRDRRTTTGCSCSRPSSARRAATGCSATASGHARARSARPPARRGVRARRPRAGEGRARRRGASTSTSCSGCSPSLRSGARRLRTGPEAAQRVAALGCARPDGASRRSTCSTSSSCMPPASWSAGGCSSSNGWARRWTRRTRRSRTTAGPSPRPTKPSGRRNRSGSRDTGAVDELLRAALEARRRAEIERGVTLVGPHRDDWQLTIEGLDARTQASQGEQRTLALALRLAGRGVVRELTGTPPVLLLDDVFSELDASRSSALVRNLPPGQTLLTTAGAIPRRRRAPIRCCGSSAGRVESRRADEAVRSERATSRCRCATRSRRSVASSGCRLPTSSRRSSARGREIVGEPLAPHAAVRSVRDGVCTVDGRRSRAGRPNCATPSTSSCSGPERAAGPGVVTSMRVVVTRRRESGPEPPRNGVAEPRFWYTVETEDTPSDQGFRVPERGVASTLTSGSVEPIEGVDAWRTRPRTSPFSRVFNRSASGPACTSARPVRRACTTSSTRSSTTPSTRRWRATRPASTSPCWPTAAAGSSTTAAGSRSTPTPSTPTSRRPRSCSRCCTRAASSAARATRSPAACTASASRS